MVQYIFFLCFCLKLRLLRKSPDYLKKEKSNAILSILNNMKEEYKSILILKYDMELSYKEIALLLGTNEDVIKTYMYRARNKFKEEWRMINEQVWWL